MTPAAGATGRPDVAPDLLAATVDQLGAALVSVDQYVLPFEVASVLLLAALIGSIAVAWPEEVVGEGAAVETTVGASSADVGEATSSEEEAAPEAEASPGEEAGESVAEASEQASEEEE